MILEIRYPSDKIINGLCFHNSLHKMCMCIDCVIEICDVSDDL